MWGEKKDAIGQENDSCMAFSLIKLKRGSEGTQSQRNETREPAEAAKWREVEKVEKMGFGGGSKGEEKEFRSDAGGEKKIRGSLK